MKKLKELPVAYMEDKLIKLPSEIYKANEVAIGLRIERDMLKANLKQAKSMIVASRKMKMTKEQRAAYAELSTKQLQTEAIEADDKYRRAMAALDKLNNVLKVICKIGEMKKSQ